MATTASVYNYERTTRQILKRHRKDAASFVIHLHAQFMRFEKQVRASAERRLTQDGFVLFEARTKVRPLCCLADQRRNSCDTYATSASQWTC